MTTLDYAAPGARGTRRFWLGWLIVIVCVVVTAGSAVYVATIAHRQEQARLAAERARIQIENQRLAEIQRQRAAFFADWEAELEKQNAATSRPIAPPYGTLPK